MAGAGFDGRPAWASALSDDEYSVLRATADHIVTAMDRTADWDAWAEGVVICHPGGARGCVDLTSIAPLLEELSPAEREALVAELFHALLASHGA